MCNYDFDTHKSSNHRAVGHFTQIVWKKSLELGIGRSYKGDCTYVVARYKPPGNYFGREPENVFKGTYDSSFCENPVWVPTIKGESDAQGKSGRRVKAKGREDSFFESKDTHNFNRKWGGGDVIENHDLQSKS